MFFFYNPDRTQYPDIPLKMKSDTQLEAVTGADFCLSPFPLLPSANLEPHIQRRALFVQVKVGYDICSFDALKNASARIQAAKIPQPQAILLPIGDYWKDENGLLRLKGQRPFGNTTFDTLDTIFDMWRMRGGTVHCDPTTPKDISELPDWIERKIKHIEKIEKEGKREIYPPSPEFIPDDIWQSVEEIRDWRKIMVSGFDDFGSKKAQSVFEYAEKYIPEDRFNFFHILCLLTDQDQNGKPLHNIPLIGKKTHEYFREVLGCKDGWNLGEVATWIAFYSGAKWFADQFLKGVEKKGAQPKDVFNKLIDLIPKTIDEEEVPF